LLPPYPKVIFYPIAAAAFLVFALGIVWHARFWAQGAPSQGSIFQGASWRHALQTLVANGLLQGRLLRESPLRWLMHILIVWGVAELFFVGSLGNMVNEFAWVTLPKDRPWFALLNEASGLLLVVGVVFSLGRRYILRPRHLLTAWDEGVVLLWLLAAALTGYLLEAARLKVEGVAPSPAVYSFLGYGLALLVRPLNVAWSAAYP